VPAKVIEFEPGGVIAEHVKRWQDLASSGADVEIRGPCFSACTLVVGYIPKERLCFGDYASLQFHRTRDPAYAPGLPESVSGHALSSSLWAFSQYPRDIQNWLTARGGVASMTLEFWELDAPELWAMGYRRCEPKPAPSMTVRPPPPRLPYVGYRPVWK
jgi:hypothetical protein